MEGVLSTTLPLAAAGAVNVGDSEGVMESGFSNKPVWGGWGKTNTVAVCSLGEVMSEELIEELRIKDELSLCKTSPCDAVEDFGVLLAGIDEVDTSSDLLIAQMLQLQMDSEHDQQLKREENKWNGVSKVRIAYDKYRSVHPALQSDADAEYYDRGEVEETEEIKDNSPNIGRSGISGKGKNIVTKHDAAICSRRNVRKVMENFPPGFETGDDSSLDMRLPNHVYNQLKIHSNIDCKRNQRLHEKKEHSTAEHAIDSKTRLIMYKLVNSGLLTEIHGAISAGKESVVFHATGGSSPTHDVPQECALKVFKTTLAEFKNRCDYVRGDVRFFKDEFKKQNPRKLMKIWAEKEEINLRRMRKCGISCPVPVVLKKHVLVMSFIGENHVPAPKLKDAILSDSEWQIAYDQCVQYAKTMYGTCQLVHADLSEYNILWYNGSVHFIDVAQAVDVQHPRAKLFLLRDCQNICEFFSKKGVQMIPTHYQLFNEITGLSFKGQDNEFLSEIQDYDKDERMMKLGLSKTDYPFDYFFEKACEQSNHNLCLNKENEHDDDDDDDDDDDEPDDDDDDDDEPDGADK